MHTAIDHTQKEHNIRELQTMLRGLSYPDPTYPRPAVTGITDSVTEDAVRSFQRRMGFEETGQTDLRTWDALVRAYTDAVLRHTPADPLFPVPGEAFFLQPQPRSFVLLLQVLLGTLSDAVDVIPPLPLSGVYDGPTARAIAAVQSLAGIPPTGRMDGTTWNTLAALYNLEVRKFFSSPPIKHP